MPDRRADIASAVDAPRHWRWTWRLEHLLSLVGLVLFVAAIGVMHHALAGHQLHDIRQQLQTIPANRVAFAIGLTLLSYLVLSLYDRLALNCPG